MAERRKCFSIGDEFVGRVDRWKDEDLMTLYDRVMQIRAQSAHALEVIEGEFRARLEGPAVAGILATQLTEGSDMVYINHFDVELREPEAVVD